MPLKPPHQPPKDKRDWDQWTREVEVKPDNDTVSASMIIDGAVTNGKLRDSAACSVIGRAENTSGDVADIPASTNGHYLRRSGDELGFSAIEDADIPSTIARDSEVTAAIEAHEAASDPHPDYTTSTELAAAITTHEAADDPHPDYARSNTSETILGDWQFSNPVKLRSYNIASLPAASTYAGALVYVTDETGGAVPAFSDGSSWRRVTDRNIVS